MSVLYCVTLVNPPFYASLTELLTYWQTDSLNLWLSDILIESVTYSLTYRFIKLIAYRLTFTELLSLSDKLTYWLTDTYLLIDSAIADLMADALTDLLTNLVII
jgi:hypothetical protein